MSRSLITRINNHDLSSKTPQYTDVTRHSTNNPNYTVCFNNPINLDRSKYWRKLLIKETLMIQQKNPDLNSAKLQFHCTHLTCENIFFVRHCSAPFFLWFASDKLLLPKPFIC